MTDFGGYSSLDMQQRQLAEAYRCAQQRGGMSAGVVTAMVDPSYSSSAGSVHATVVTEAKSAPERKRVSFRSQVIYWLLMAALSVLSIWPAWGPHLLPPARAENNDVLARSTYVVPEIITRDVAWRYFVISTTSGGKIRVPGEHFAYRDDGFLYIVNPHETQSFRIDASWVTNLMEETELDWAIATNRHNGAGIP